jgi:DNA-binding NarL/FixJ family response regulator
MTAPPHRLLIVEDEVIVAEHMRAVLSRAGYLAPTPVTSASEAEAAVAAERPDLLLIDIALERGQDGISLAENLGSRYQVPVVFVSAHADRSTLARASRLQPSGFVVKPFLPQQLVAAVAAALGGSPRGGGAGAKVGEADGPAYDLLTPSETQVLDALVTGLRIRSIAAERGLSKHTIRNQVKSILFKLDVRSQEELVLKCRRHPRPPS